VKTLSRVSLIWTALHISLTARFTESLQKSQCRARRSCASTWASLKAGVGQFEFRSSGKQSSRVSYISDIQRCILWTIWLSQFCKCVLETISQLIFLNGYISAIWNRHINLQIKWFMFNRCLSTTNSVPVLTIWRRHCLILPFMACIILTVQMFSTYYLLLIHGKVLAESILYLSSIVRNSYFSSPYHNQSIFWDKPLSTECAEMSN
jgi:hypothetical protein